ncbi:hypothetical protein, partial [Rhizobium binae]|uniref:hypothetical protein n=1 Tax=Rhizobium binae TaxID=1138190 RepID=UPI001C82EFDB
DTSLERTDNNYCLQTPETGGEIIPESGGAIISEQWGGFIGIGTKEQGARLLSDVRDAARAVLGERAASALRHTGVETMDHGSKPI